MTIRKTLPLALSLAIASPTLADFIPIDGFTDAAQSDAHGLRSYSGQVTIVDRPGTGYAQLISGGTPDEPYPASLSYSFIPAPLVVGPVVRIRARNTQDSSDSTGVLSVGINGGESVSQTLYGGQGEYRDYDFDFTAQFINEVAVISELRLDWLRTVGDTGAGQLWIDSIDVQDVPEPASIALIAVAAVGFVPPAVRGFRERRQRVRRLTTGKR